MPQSSESERLLRSQSGFAAFMSLSAVPSSFLNRIESKFRVLRASESVGSQLRAQPRASAVRYIGVRE